MESGLTTGDLALMDKGNSGFGSDGMAFMWIFALLILAGGGFGLGGWGSSAATTNAVSQADLQRAIDLNSIQTGQAGISSDIQRGIYEINGATKDAAYNNLGEIRDVQSAVNVGNSNIINNLTALQSQMQNCCCETKQTIMENRYLDSQNASAIMANDTANTQKILDAIATNRMADMQNQINQLQLQNAVSGVVRYPMATTYGAGSSCFSNGCGCGTV